MHQALYGVMQKTWIATQAGRECRALQESDWRRCWAGQGVWKWPTGIVVAGEDIIEAAEREVLEETGIRAVSECVLAVRQAHGVAFGKSDIFAAVAMRYPLPPTLAPA